MAHWFKFKLVVSCPFELLDDREDPLVSEAVEAAIHFASFFRTTIFGSLIPPVSYFVEPEAL
jgi:hypothetical protein